MKYIDHPDIKKRKVGGESSRTFIEKLENGFFDKYMAGEGCDVGCAGYTNATSILPTAKPVNLGDEGYDGVHLPFADESLDYIYSSHMLEHAMDIGPILRDWMRVLKIKGHCIIIVPHQWLYERKLNLPSDWNGEHQHFFTGGKLLSLVENILQPNTYRVRLLEDGDKNYRYEVPIGTHPDGQYEITLVLQKIDPPMWKIK